MSRNKFPRSEDCATRRREMRVDETKWRVGMFQHGEVCLSKVPISKRGDTGTWTRKVGREEIRFEEWSAVIGKRVLYLAEVDDLKHLGG